LSSRYESPPWARRSRSDAPSPDSRVGSDDSTPFWASSSSKPSISPEVFSVGFNKAGSDAVAGLEPPRVDAGSVNIAASIARGVVDAYAYGFPQGYPLITPDDAYSYILDSISHLHTLPEENARRYPAILLLGPPGIGKTQVVYEASREAAERLGRVFVDITDHRARAGVVEELEKDPRASEKYFLFLDLRLTEVEPYDITGIPRDAGRYTEYKPMAWAYALSLAPGVLFLDELTNIQDPEVRAASLKIIYDKAAGFVRMHPRLFIACAGNLPTQSSLAEVLPEPVVNRLQIFYVTAGSIDSWARVVSRKISSIADKKTRKRYEETLALVIDFHRRTNGRYLLQLPRERRQDANENFATPRTWEGFVLTTPIDRLRAMARTGDGAMLYAHLTSLLGASVAKEFIAYLKGRLDSGDNG